MPDDTSAAQGDTNAGIADYTGAAQCPDAGIDPASSSAAPVSSPPVTRKLDLASGQSPRQGFEGVDVWPGAKHVVNLQHYPWPFEDESVLELNCSHYIEHIPMHYVAGRPCRPCLGLGLELSGPRLRDSLDRPVGPLCRICGGTGREPKEALFAFFDECWRILVPDGWLHIVVPAHRSDGAFQDPTHRRFITAQTFAYMNEDWRRANRLDHYNVDCNFIGGCDPIVDRELTLRVAETAQKMMQHEWNRVISWQARLQKKPRLPPVDQVK